MKRRTEVSVDQKCETDRDIELGIMDEAETCRITSLSRMTRWRMVKAGTFPAPVKISKRRHGWKRADVRRWQAGLIPASGNKEARA